MSIEQVGTQHVDLRAGAGAPAIVSITTIGTCRLADPIGAVAGRLPLSRNAVGIYGFVHTSKEVLQQIDVLEGRELPAELRRFICSATYETPRERGGTDLFLVEVSSQKEIHFRGHLLQINCMDRVFQDRRELFDALFRHKHAHERDARARALGQLPSFAAADETERAVLLEAVVHVTRREELEADLHAIAARLPGPVVFACHIDVPDAAGRTIESRARLCGWMRELCAAHGYALFDPAPQVAAFGRARALAEDGRDVNHYAAEFQPVVGRLLHETFALPLLGGPPAPEAPRRLAVVPAAPIAAAPEAAPPAPAPAAAAPPPPAQAAAATPDDVRAVLAEAKARVTRGEVDEAEMLLRGAAIDHPGAAELFAMLGSVAHHRGDETSALASLQRALHLDPRAVEPRMLLVRIAQRLNRTEEACTHALELVGNAPDNHKALSVAAKALLKAKRFHEAASIWRRIAMLRPGEPAPLVEVARCELKGRNPEEAVRAADAALLRSAADVAALTLKAEALQRLKRMADLAEVAMQLARFDPAAAIALVPALVAAAHQEHAAAVIAAVRAQGHGIGADPVLQAGLIRSLTQRARAAAERGEAPAAAHAWRAVLLLEPGHARALSGLRKLLSPARREVRARTAAGDLPAALAACRHGLALGPDDPQLLRDHAQLLERREDWAAAAQAWERLAFTGTGTPDHLRRAAKAATRAGALTDALRLYAALPEEERSGVASKVGSLTRKLISSMRLDFAAGRIREAVAQAAVIRLRDPRNTAAARLLGKAVSSYRKLLKVASADGDLVAQEALCREILAIDPNRADALKPLVKLHLAARRWPEAIDTLERLTRLEPEEARHWHKLASACRSARRFDRGVAAALKAVELEPGNTRGLERLSDMLNRQALAA